MKRKTKAPVPLERIEQAMVVKWLTWRGHAFFAAANGAMVGGRNRFAAVNALKATGLVRGAPDLVIGTLALDGRPVCVEMKRMKGGGLTPEQEHMHERLRLASWHVVVGRGFDDARAQLERLGL